jgi:predicted phosphodiesterase
MRVAVISDIHANLYALEAVLAAIDKERPDVIWNLGDTVGYGPRPNECCTVARSRAALSLVGNHDLAVLDGGNVAIEDFNLEAAAAATWTRETLSGESREFLQGLDASSSAEGVELYHGSPRDPVWEYVLTVEAARASLQTTSAALVLVGHSHVPLALRLDGDDVVGGLAPAGTDIDLASGRWLLNPGSVGQPRDGDPRAAFCLLDLEARSGLFERVEYPVGNTQAEMRQRGLPAMLAERLAYGA